jgi:hypothetical protein
VRSQAEWDEVHRLIASGMNDCAIARATGIPRPTVKDWRHQGAHRRKRAQRRSSCPRCDLIALDETAYAYLLGLYLGDGCLSRHRRDVYRLRISLDAKYPNIIAECTRAMAIEQSYCPSRADMTSLGSISSWDRKRELSACVS